MIGGFVIHWTAGGNQISIPSQDFSSLILAIKLLLIVGLKKFAVSKMYGFDNRVAI